MTLLTNSIYLTHTLLINNGTRNLSVMQIHTDQFISHLCMEYFVCTAKYWLESHSHTNMIKKQQQHKRLGTLKLSVLPTH